MYRIIKNFTDKYNKDIEYKVDEVVEFTDERAKEILTVGKLIEKIEENEQVQEEILPETTEKTTKKPKKARK